MFVVQFYLLMSTNETSNLYPLNRLLVLVPDQGGISFTTKCKFHYQPSTQTIDFTNTFSQLSSSNQHIQRLLQNSQLFYLDERHRTKHFLGEFPLEDCRLFFDDWAASSILISYRKHHPPPNKNIKQAIASKKSRERTIKEVRTYIEQWRQVAQSNFSSGSKAITLVKAAQSIGMSKKSLDDYLRYMKIAQRLNFDFQTYQTQKMGFLRAFVKAKLREPFDGNILNEIDNYWDSNYISKQYS